MKQVRCLPLVALAGLVVAAGSADDLLMLRWKFVPGEKRTYTVEQEANITQMQMKTATRQTVVEEVLDGAAEKGTVSRTITALEMKVTSAMMGNVSFDSAKKEDAGKAAHPLIAPIAALLNAAVKVDVTHRGEVKGIDGLDPLLAKAGPMAAIQKGAMEMAIQRLYIPFPEAGVKTGDTWPQQLTMTTPMGTVTLSYVYTYAGNEKRQDVDCAKLTFAVTAGVSRTKAAGGGKEEEDLTDEGKDEDKDGKPAGSNGGQPVGEGTAYVAATGGFLVEYAFAEKSAGGTGKTTVVLVKE